MEADCRKNTVQLTRKQRAVILADKTNAFKVLAQDVAFWKRLGDNDNQTSYDYPVKSVPRHLDRGQMEKNNTAQVHTCASHGPLHPWP